MAPSTQTPVFPPEEHGVDSSGAPSPEPLNDDRAQEFLMPTREAPVR